MNTPSFVFRRSLLSAILLIAVAAATPGCAHFDKPPQNLDYSRTRTSEAGLYRGTIRAEADPIPKQRLHTWTLHLETNDGKPVETAHIEVDGGMPQHGHGLPTKPRVTRALGDGQFLVEGMKFNMGGWWVVEFPVVADAGTDTLVFNLSL
ncbi:MAG TPA: FixH family protein [Rhodothermales bacterium]